MQPNVMLTGAGNFNQAEEVGRLQPFVLLCARKTAPEQVNSTFRFARDGQYFGEYVACGEAYKNSRNYIRAVPSP